MRRWALGLGLVFVWSCGPYPGYTVVGDGVRRDEVRQLSSFTAIEVGHAYRATLTVGAPQEVHVIADRNLHAYIETFVRDETLVVRPLPWTAWLVPSRPIEVVATVPALRRFELSGASTLNASEVDGDELTAELSGASQATLSGRATQLMVEVSGASQLRAGELYANDLDVSASGASLVEALVSGVVTGELSGASHLRLMGAPERIEVQSSGGSTVSVSGASR